MGDTGASSSSFANGTNSAGVNAPLDNMERGKKRLYTVFTYWPNL